MEHRSNGSTRMSKDGQAQRNALRWYRIPLFVLIVALCLPALAIWFVCWTILAIFTLASVWLCWTTQGITMLTIYSNSPHWQSYFEEGVLPLVGSSSKVLNWSERLQWRFSLKTCVFKLFGGDREFNPMIILLPPFRWPKYIRFQSAFKNAKHGKVQQLRSCEQMLADFLGQPVCLDRFDPR